MRLKKVLTGVMISAALIVGGAVSVFAAGTDAVSLQSEGFKIRPLKGTAMDYSDRSNWMYAETDGGDMVDLFFVYPTVFGGEEYPDIDDNAIIRAVARANYAKTASCFESSCNIYAPYYRQTNMNVASSLTGKEYEEYQMQEQRTDVYAALDYYFANYNKGKPFILAGHSQGACMVKIILGEYMQAHPELLDRMVAAYPIGFSIDRAYLAEHPYLKFANGSDDTGVIVSWNTEGPGNYTAGNTLLVEEGAISINPITWTRDETAASPSQSLGSREQVKGTLDFEMVPDLADATVDTDRGTVICTTSDDFFSSTDAFGPESLHQHDYDFYYYNIQVNAWDRIASYYRQQAEM
ncbi:MAG: DUF3089 domain-containing protein [Lachnospiraceae bacterium]|nr:DUF3089 domain-containing protein [Lachnospiraceae bacterium]